MFDLPPLLDLRYRIQAISLGELDGAKQSGECGVLELIGVGWVVGIEVGMLLGKGACVLVRASTVCQLPRAEEEISIPC
jgi:hypothetical protein